MGRHHHSHPSRLQKEDQPRGLLAWPAQAGASPGLPRTGDAGRSHGTGRPFQEGPAGAADDSHRPTQAPHGMLRARGRHGSQARREASPLLEYQAQRRGQRFRRTWINYKKFQEESKSNDEITYPAQRKCSTPGIAHLVWPSLAAVHNHLQKFKICERLNLSHK